MFFVVSVGRSGSQTIADLLDSSPNGVCPHEPEPRLLVEATQYLYGELAQEDAVRLLRATRPTVRDLAPGQQYGESHHRLSLMIPALHEAFPDAKFVWLIRDGRKTVASMVARRAYSGKLFSPYPNTMVWEDTQIRADRLGEMSSRAWQGLSRFEKCCWLWARKNRLIEEKLIACGCDWMLIRLEELEAHAGDLFAFLGLEKPPAIIVRRLNPAQPVAGRGVPQHWRAWNGEHAQAFTTICGAAMDEWYPGWREEVEGVWIAPRRAAQARIWVARRMRKIYDSYLLRYQVGMMLMNVARRILPARWRPALKRLLLPWQAEIR
jgi:hypothetical protein